MDCWQFLLRFYMLASSVILFLSGAVGLVAGVWMKVSPSSIQGGILEGWTTTDVEPLSYLLMAAGLVLLHVGLLGGCAAVRDARCLRLLFSVVALMAIMAQAAGLTVALKFPGEMAKVLGPKAMELMGENKVQVLWDVGVVMALEAACAASSMALYCISKRRN